MSDHNNAEDSIPIIQEELLEIQLSEATQLPVDQPSEATQPPTKRPDCMICFDPTNEFVMSCKHPCCYECFSDFCSSRISKGSPAIGCPYPQCKVELGIEDIKKFINPSEVEKYENFILQLALRKIPNIRFCPAADCGYAVVACRSHKVIECEVCTTRFCYNCRQPEHMGSCRKTNYGDDLMSEEIKPCPSCLLPTTKNEGCNRMHCACGVDWCWLCGEKAGELHFKLGTDKCGLFARAIGQTDKEDDDDIISPVWDTVLSMILFPIFIALSPLAAFILLCAAIKIIAGREFNRSTRKKLKELQKTEQELGHPISEDEKQEFLVKTVSESIADVIRGLSFCFGLITVSPGIYICALSLIPFLTIYVYLYYPIRLIIKTVMNIRQAREIAKRIHNRKMGINPGGVNDNVISVNGDGIMNDVGVNVNAVDVANAVDVTDDTGADTDADNFSKDDGIELENLVEIVSEEIIGDNNV